MVTRRAGVGTGFGARGLFRHRLGARRPLSAGQAAHSFSRQAVRPGAGGGRSRAAFRLRRGIIRGVGLWDAQAADLHLRSYLSEALRSLGYSVVASAHAQGALAILSRNSARIDLMLTDVVMPGMNGRDLGRRAQEIRPGLRVLYMSGYSRNAVVHQGRLDDGIELLQKPITQTHLASRVRDVLDRQQVETSHSQGTKR